MGKTLIEALVALNLIKDDKINNASFISVFDDLRITMEDEIVRALVTILVIFWSANKQHYQILQTNVYLVDECDKVLKGCRLLSFVLNGLLSLWTGLPDSIYLINAL